ncbi:MAG TPA: SdrD B-like domain-containing protein, partial [Geobacteraceae bacterium]
MIFDLRRVAAMLLLAMMLGGCSKTATQSPASGPTSSTATATRSAASRTEPSAAPTTLPTLIAPALPPASMGPELKDFPSNYNPLTAQPVSDPASMKLPAMLVSISNFPATARPQAGLSFAPYVFEFSITEGATRFLTVFYGDYPKPEVPVTGNCPVRMEPFEQTSDAIVGNRVWLDWNGDGVQQFEEPGVGGVCVNLYDASGAQVDATTTDSNGYYGFNLPAADGRYVIEVVQPPGMLFTTFKAGGNDDLDSDVDPPSGRMEVTARGTLLTLDAGLVVVPGAEPTPNPDQPPPKPEVGPVRSGRLLYADLAAMFQDSCLVYAFASPEVLSQIPYCSMVSHEIQGGGYMLPIERMWAIAKDNRKDHTVFDYSSNLYTQAPPPGGEPAKRLDVYFAYLNQSGWRYDPLMQSYLRYTDTTVQSEAGQLHPDTDRLTRRQLHFENIIILTADHVVVTPTNLDIDLEQGGKGPAYLFR